MTMQNRVLSEHCTAPQRFRAIEPLVHCTDPGWPIINYGITNFVSSDVIKRKKKRHKENKQ